MKDSDFLEHKTVFAETDVTTFQAELDSMCFTSPSAAALASKSCGSRAATSSPFLVLLGVGLPIPLKQSLICVAVSFCNPSSVTFSSPRVTFPTTSLKADFSRWALSTFFSADLSSASRLAFFASVSCFLNFLAALPHCFRGIELGSCPWVAKLCPQSRRVDAFLLGQLLLF